MKRTGKSLINLSRFVCSVKYVNSSPSIRLLCTADDPTETNQREVSSKPSKDSFHLEHFRLRKLKGSAKANRQSEPRPSNSNWFTLKNENSCGSDSAEVVSSFQELGLTEQVIKAVEKMGVFVPREIQCVGIPAILEGKSVVLSSGSASGRTLSYLLPLVQMLRRDDALVAMKPKHPRAIVLCTTEESADHVFHMAKFISHHARLNSSMESGGDSSKSLVDVSNAPIGMLVGTPTEVLQHIEEGNIFCSDIKYLVLDEADALINHGFGPEISKMLSPLKDCALKSNSQGVQTILVTAAISEILGERFSSLMECLERDNAGKVAAMLLEMDQTEVLDLVESLDALKEKLAEAMDSLHSSASGS